MNNNDDKEAEEVLETEFQRTGQIMDGTDRISLVNLGHKV
jgi:hypothetical protein